MTDHVAWVALSLLRGIGGVTMQALMTRFGSAKAVLKATPTDLRRVRGIGEKTASAIQNIDMAQMQRACERWQSAGVQIVTRHDDHYPQRLLSISDAPPTLFYRTEKHPALLKEQATVAIIGTRSPNTDTRLIAFELGKILAASGYVVVSGLAVGIDEYAFKGAQSIMAGGWCLGVLGSGILNVYPPENTQLAQRTCESGILLCEVAPDAPVSTPGLVARNRLISGLADSVIIVETAVDGGAMHAARAAYKQGRTLIAVDNAASGNRKLIDEGFASALAPDSGNLSALLA